VVLTRGAYAAVANVPWPASMLATPGLITRKLEDRGFTDVRVSEAKPPGFPLASSGDYYVSVQWPSDPKVFDVPSAVVEHGRA